MKQAIEQKLRPILGLPIWGIENMPGLLSLEIGDHQVLFQNGGESKERGTFAMNIECSWSWKKGNEVVADPNSSAAAIGRLVPVTCLGLSAGDDGSLEIVFDNGARLLVSTPMVQTRIGVRPPERQFWAFFEPAEDDPRFVVGSRGIK
ncbi:MAG: hypothetical protein O3B24_06035 [Verrucomicrobia bacterium]|nr:hypothetical protein [Verrucomicrobiota bacterium]MDA1118433.1 hypothetical protein [Pseudomonadota bacterium]